MLVIRNSRKIPMPQRSTSNAVTTDQTSASEGTDRTAADAVPGTAAPASMVMRMVCGTETGQQ